MGNVCQGFSGRKLLSAGEKNPNLHPAIQSSPGSSSSLLKVSWISLCGFVPRPESSHGPCFRWKFLEKFSVSGAVHFCDLFAFLGGVSPHIVLLLRTADLRSFAVSRPLLLSLPIGSEFLSRWLKSKWRRRIRSFLAALLARRRLAKDLETTRFRHSYG